MILSVPGILIEEPQEPHRPDGGQIIEHHPTTVQPHQATDLMAGRS